MSIDHIPYPAFVMPQSAPPASAAPASSGGMTSITIHPEKTGAGGADAASVPGGGYWSNGKAPSFHDLLDAVNPLQHIPVISTIYQKLTGDTPSPADDIWGGLLFGGPLGMLGGIANEIVKQASGKSIGDNMLAAITGSGSASPAATQTAQNAAPAATHVADATTNTTPHAADEGHATEQLYASLAPAQVPPAHAAATYKNAQEAVLALFDPEALSQKTNAAALQP
jgi:hypothetical protein